MFALAGCGSNNTQKEDLSNQDSIVEVCDTDVLTISAIENDTIFMDVVENVADSVELEAETLSE